jgi:hypothetical protein
MNDSFSRKVSSGDFSLFARMDDFRAPFVAIPSDHWSLYKVTNWKNGAAAAQDGRVIFSIHAKTANSARSAAGRKPIYDQNHINAHVQKTVDLLGFPTPNGETGWQSLADVGRLVGEFCLTTKGQEPAISTLQDLARKALTAAKAKTGNR